MSKYPLFSSSIVMLVLSTVACGGQTSSPETSTNTSTVQSSTSSDGPIVERPTVGGLVLVEIDLNRDGTADVFNYYRERAEADRLLVRREVDLNHDGRIDVHSLFDEVGSIQREDMDGDFDGRVDWVDHYQGGVRTLSEVDTNQDGAFDMSRYYVAGEIARKERDTDADGRVDYWELYRDGEVVNTGRDTDGDGEMDQRLE